jgi:hypothetical protein
MAQFTMRENVSIDRIYLLIALVFLESILPLLQSRLASGSIPSLVELLGYLCTGGIQVVTMLLVLLRKTENAPPES